MDGQGQYVNQMTMPQLQVFYRAVLLIEEFVTIMDDEDVPSEQVVERLTEWCREEAEGEDGPVRMLQLIKLAIGNLAMLHPEACCTPHAVEEARGEVEKMIAAKHGGTAN